MASPTMTLYLSVVTDSLNSSAWAANLYSGNTLITKRVPAGIWNASTPFETCVVLALLASLPSRGLAPVRIVTKDADRVQDHLNTLPPSHLLAAFLKSGPYEISEPEKADKTRLNECQSAADGYLKDFLRAKAAAEEQARAVAMEVERRKQVAVLAAEVTASKREVRKTSSVEEQEAIKTQRAEAVAEEQAKNSFEAAVRAAMVRS